ncbi:MAG: bifunctional precorrin-2 dehydrogenase/sirohydrochlorin ferrochelatase [candidate division NC10 bacterium]|nr:bifunctional precorrin-2 dehydrogenase/sirohydrochlorin ferrochelatase [candidate division NC10 bacterium]
MRKFYPMMVDVAGRRCLIVGGGPVAERKVTLLLECGADVEVVSPTASPRLTALATVGRLRLRRRPVRPADLAGAFLVVAATDDPQVNRDVAERARRAGGLVNVADDPGACSFLVPAVVRRGDLTVAISTGGGSPALAKKLRQRLERTIGPEYETFVAALRLLRERARQAIADPEERQAIYRRAVESDLFEEAARGDSAAVAARIDDLVRFPPRAGAGPHPARRDGFLRRGRRAE